MLDNLAGSMTLMQSAVEGVQNSFGQRLTPYVRGFVDSITDAMPAVTVALNDFMDTVDKKQHMKTVIGTMTASDEWQNADMFGRWILHGILLSVSLLPTGLAEMGNI